MFFASPSSYISSATGCCRGFVGTGCACFFLCPVFLFVFARFPFLGCRLSALPRHVCCLFSMFFPLCLFFASVFLWPVFSVRVPFVSRSPSRLCCLPVSFLPPFFSVFLVPCFPLCPGGVGRRPASLFAAALLVPSLLLLCLVPECYWFPQRPAFVLLGCALALPSSLPLRSVCCTPCLALPSLGSIAGHFPAAGVELWGGWLRVLGAVRRLLGLGWWGCLCVAWWRFFGSFFGLLRSSGRLPAL